MKTEDFIEILKHPEKAADQSLEKLRALAHKYSYSQIFQLIYAMHLRYSNQHLFDRQLAKASILTNDRTVLFNLLEEVPESVHEVYQNVNQQLADEEVGVETTTANTILEKPNVIGEFGIADSVIPSTTGLNDEVETPEQQEPMLESSGSKVVEEANEKAEAEADVKAHSKAQLLDAMNPEGYKYVKEPKEIVESTVENSKPQEELTTEFVEENTKPKEAPDLEEEIKPEEIVSISAEDEVHQKESSDEKETDIKESSTIVSQVPLTSNPQMNDRIKALLERNRKLKKDLDERRGVVGKKVDEPTNVQEASSSVSSLAEDKPMQKPKKEESAEQKPIEKSTSEEEEKTQAENKEIKKTALNALVESLETNADEKLRVESKDEKITEKQQKTELGALIESFETEVEKTKNSETEAKESSEDLIGSSADKTPETEIPEEEPNTLHTESEEERNLNLRIERIKERLKELEEKEKEMDDLVELAESEVSAVDESKHDDNDELLQFLMKRNPRLKEGIEAEPDLDAEIENIESLVETLRGDEIQALEDEKPELIEESENNTDQEDLPVKEEIKAESIKANTGDEDETALEDEEENSEEDRYSFSKWLKEAKSRSSSFKRSVEQIKESGQENIQEELPAEDQEKPEEEELGFEQKMELLDSFVEKLPDLKKRKPLITNPPKTDLIKKEQPLRDDESESDSLVTETLAKVYIKQKHYKKAIQAYEILKLKYPEKSSFFASQISEINKLSNSK